MFATIAPMARERKPPTVTVRLDKQLARMLRVVAANKDKDTSDYLAELLKPIISEEYRTVGREISDDAAEGKKRPKGRD